MNTELSTLLNKLSETKDPIEEVEVATALQALCKENDTTEPPLEWLAEVMAFDFCENYQHGEAGWGTYFGPIMVWNNGDGTATESPSIKRVTPEMLKYWERRAKETINPVLKSRYADLVWDFSKQVTGTSADVENARIAIDSILLIASGKYHKYEVEVITKLARALSLAIAINDQTRINKVIETILKYEDEVAEDCEPGLWGFGFDLLFSNRKVKLTREQQDKILSDIEARLERVSRISDASKPDPWAAEAAALRLASYYRKASCPTDVRRVLTQYGKAFEEHCNSGTPLQVSFWLQGVHSVYLDYGLKEDADEVARQIREIGPKVVNDIKPISHTMEIPKEKMDKYLEAVTDGNMATVLRRIAGHFMPERDKVEDQVHDLAAKTPLSFIISKQLQNHRGRPVATVGSLDDDLDGNIVHQMSQNMAISAIFLNQALVTATAKFGLSTDNVLDYLYESPVFQQDKRDIIRTGLDAYFSGNHLVAIHLLTPQIEDAIRNLVEMTGGTALKPSRSGGLHLKTLDELLRDERISAVFGEDASFYLRVLFTDQRGWNVRNNVCHGIIPGASFDPSVSDRIIHALLCFALVREKRAETSSV